MTNRRGLFVVDLGDLDLPDDVSERITRSIQKSVLLELAAVDRAPRFSVALQRPEDGDRQPPWADLADWDRTRGIWIDIVHVPGRD